MKTYIIPAAISILIIAGCSATKTGFEYDDVYATGRQPEKEVKTVKQPVDQTVDPDYFVKNETVSSDYVTEDYEAGQYVYYGDEPYYSESETVQSPEGTTYITHNYYGSGLDYYDYSYASRINRFYNPYYGFGYYSPFYLGFSYSPWGFYDPFWYRPSFYFGMHWGWGSFGWGYPFYYPYYWSPYSSYWYNRGYWDSYWGYNYYGWYSSNNYYGHRPSRGSTNSPDGIAGRYRTSEPIGRTGTLERIERESTSGTSITGKSREITGRTDALTADPQPRQGETSRQVAGQTGSQSDLGQSKQTDPQTRTPVVESDVRGSANVTTKPQSDVRQSASGSPQSRYTYKAPDEGTSKTQTYRPGQGISTDGQTQRTVPSQRYQKPATQPDVRQSETTRPGGAPGNTQVYSKPQPNTRNTYSRPSQSNINRSYSQPERTNTQRYSEPAGSNQRVAPQPSGTTTRSYTPPSSTRSSGSYSPPASSGRNSYSAPASSGSSTPSRSSSGTSSGSGSRSSSGSRGGR
jgi:hypothetical protein